MRWFGLVCFIILFALSYKKKTLKLFWISMAMGMVTGFAVDFAGINLGFWNFPGQPFLSSAYFAIVIPCWGAFGATINMIWDWSNKSGLKTYSFIALSLFALYEIPNLATVSWSYATTAIIIAISWLPLILAFRVLYLMVTNKLALATINNLLELKNGKAE